MEQTKNNPNLLIAKKTEKIITAVYLISQFLNESENLKQELRNTANSLLKQVNLFAYSERENIFSLYKDSLDQVSLLILFLTLAKNTKLISEMNCALVIEALRSLENILVNEQFSFNSQTLNILEEDFFYDLARKPSELATNPSTSFDVLSKRNLAVEKENALETFLVKNPSLKKVAEQKNFTSSDSQAKPLKDILIPKRQNITSLNDITQNKLKEFPRQLNLNYKSTKSAYTKASETLASATPTNVIKNKKGANRKQNRREQILNVFSRGVEVSINDISRKIVGCSVKTIQRELNNLLAEGSIAKIGEKRWSRYILA